MRCADVCWACACRSTRSALGELVATALCDVLAHAMGNGHPAVFGRVIRRLRRLA
jgi:hypothetical protein